MLTILRRDVVSSLFALLLVGGIANQGYGQEWADKLFEKKDHDFRIVGRGTKCEYHFEFSNPYEEDIHIAAVRTSCGCTTPSITKSTIHTHEKGAVVATFNTKSHIGQKAATITVVFDKPYYAEVQLKVKGFIRTDITFDPPEIAFGEFPAAEEREQEVTITHSGNSSWTINDVRSHCTNLEVRLDPPERRAGMVKYRMRVKMKAGMPEGDLRERLTLISNDREFPTTEMAISGRIRPVVGVSPSALSLGTMRSGEVVEKRLVVRADQPFEISDVVCGDERFEFEVPLGGKKVQFVKLRFHPGESDGSVAQEVKIVTDLPGNKSARCVVTGTVDLNR